MLCRKPICCCDPSLIVLSCTTATVGEYKWSGTGINLSLIRSRFHSLLYQLLNHVGGAAHRRSETYLHPLTADESVHHWFPTQMIDRADNILIQSSSSDSLTLMTLHLQISCFSLKCFLSFFQRHLVHTRRYFGFKRVSTRIFHRLAPQSGPKSEILGCNDPSLCVGLIKQTQGQVWMENQGWWWAQENLETAQMKWQDRGTPSLHDSAWCSFWSCDYVGVFYCCCWKIQQMPTGGLFVVQ